MRQLLEWAQGNPGALTFLIKVYLDEETNPIDSIIINSKLEKCQSIRGTNLYVLWSDLGNQNIETIANICENVPDDILQEACNRQDYSGRELIQEFVGQIKSS